MTDESAYLLRRELFPAREILNCLQPAEQPGAPVVAPAAAAEKIESPTVFADGESKTVAGVLIEAVPMYNLRRWT